MGRINGPSMYPYLNNSFNEDQKKDICWIKKWDPVGNLQRGMIVSFRFVFSLLSPSRLSLYEFIRHLKLNSILWNRSPTTGAIAVKRVIALEGDSVQTRSPYPVPTAEVPPGHVWVEGDNRDGNKTLDSMHYGPISINLIEGQITHVLWPWKSAGPISWWQFKGRTKVYKARREWDVRRS